MKERLQKVLAHMGVGSRREIERMILANKIKVNGEIAQLGSLISLSDNVIVEGKKIDLNETPGRRRVILYNKPEGLICTNNDPQGRQTVFEDLPYLNSGRWVQVGRLDLNTRGLLIFTNDGELAQTLAHPKYEIEREYLVRIGGDVTQKHIDKLLNGVDLEDGFAKFKSITPQGGEGLNKWFSVVLTEGRNREVRRLWENQGFTVNRLIRTRYGKFSLPKNLKQREWVELPFNGVVELSQELQLDKAFKVVTKGQGIYRKHVR